MTHHYVAIDLGASSGRVMVGTVSDGVLVLDEVHRFANGPVLGADGYHWDLPEIWTQITEGLRIAARTEAITSIGVDSWAIDHGFVDAEGSLLAPVWHHRDPRTDGVAETFWAALPADDLYTINGLQHLPFTTLYQLLASRGTRPYSQAQHVLLVPDLIAQWLTGVSGIERTNASTTGLLDIRSGRWSTTVLDTGDIRTSLLPPLREPGDVVGRLRPEIATATGLDPSVVVTTVASHDTASSVVAIPADGERFAYVACGTWALVGVELTEPVLTPESRAANFTNELGIDGTVRYLRNVMGLWVLSESLRTWREAGLPSDLAVLLADAELLPANTTVIDIDDPSLLAPGDMPARVMALCRRSAQSVPVSPAGVVRCIIDGLAAAFAAAVDDAVRLTGRSVDVVHVVGGGSQNSLLCQATADATGLPVLAGPVEATAIGNVLVQARAHGDISGGRQELRALVRATHHLTRYEPKA